MCPITQTSFIALAVSVVGSFIFGFLWYGPIFGKTWATLAGFKVENCKDQKPPVSSLLLTIVGNALTTFAMAYILHVLKAPCNVGAALMVWLGFYVPLMLGSVTWEQRPWKFFAINATFAFINLQLISAILTYVKG